MRIARIGALTFTAVCLVLAAAWLLLPTELTSCIGGDCTTVSCGSPAFPKDLIDFDDVDDATNCAGRTPASVGLYGVILAGAGLGAVALTSRRGPAPPEAASPPTTSGT
jgi:hypothetical protein